MWASRRSGCLCWIFFFLPRFPFINEDSSLSLGESLQMGDLTACSLPVSPVSKAGASVQELTIHLLQQDAGIGAELSGKTQLVESGKTFKRYSLRKLVFSFWFSSNENCRCFFWKSNSAFSLSGETTATKKTAPNLRKTYGKRKKFPVLT